MRPCYGAGVADQHHPAVDIGVYEGVVDRLDRHLFGRDRGRLGEVQPWGLWGVDPPVHPAVSWVGAVVKVGDHVDDAVTALEADIVPGAGLGSPVDRGPMPKPGL